LEFEPWNLILELEALEIELQLKEVKHKILEENLKVEKKRNNVWSLKLE
jgi:hypothetical protein